MSVLAGYIVPGRPQPLLAPEMNPGWARVRAAFDEARRRIAALQPDLLVLYSTQWPSVIGHQIQADPAPEWVHVDPEFHALGEIPYRFAMDAEFGALYRERATARGLHARTVAYRGFPIDTGSIVALKLLNPDNRIRASIVSCNMYADRAETVVLGKAAADAIARGGKRAVVVAVSALSNRLHTEPVAPADDHLASLKDDEWNKKLLELLSEGRLEDVAQLARQVAREANGDSKLKAIWWLAALMGQHNRYAGEVLAYEALYGTGGAVVELRPSAQVAADPEFDEDAVEVFNGERQVLSGGAARGASTAEAAAPTDAAPTAAGAHNADVLVASATAAPKPVGAYPHARRVGELLYLSGVGPRQPGTDAIPGGPVRGPDGAPRDYDAAAQTRAVIDNVRRILEEAGARLENVVDVTVFLIDMARDFPAFNAEYARAFASIQPTRTTVEVRALPTPIAVEFKVIAKP